MKRIRLSLTALLIGGFMFATPSPAFAEQAFAEVTCADNQGNTQMFAIGWNNSDSFFEGKGEIPRLFCEGGYARQFNLYVSDNLPIDSPLRWYNGLVPVVVPTPVPTQTPEPEPVPSIEPEPVPSIEPTLNPEPTPEPTQSESPSIEPTPEVTETTEPVVEPTVEPEPTPTPTVSVVAPVPVVEPTPTPSESVQNLPESVQNPEPEPVQDQVVVLEVPSALENIIGITAIFEAAEAFMNIGSDMTPEQREESQSVVVAAVIVGQLAMRKIK